MNALRSDRVAAGLGAICVVAGATATLMAMVIEGSLDPRQPALGDAAGNALMAVAYGGMGSLIAARRRGNLVGWALLAGGLGFGFTGLFVAYGYLRLEGAPPPGDLLARAGLAVAGGAWTTLLGSLGLLFAIFPSGRFSSRFWRGYCGILAAGFAIVWFGVATGSEALDLRGDQRFANPLYRAPFAGEGVLLGIVISLAHLAVIVAAGYLVVRFVRSRGEERTQFKWLALAVCVLLVALTFEILLNSSRFSGRGTALADAAFTVALISVPVTIAIAVLRYRLYAIDRVISRTLSYGLLTILLGTLYVVMVISIGAATRAALNETSNGLAVAGTTLIVAALFRPARGRIQAFVDRRFYRARYDAARTLEVFQVRMRDELDLDALRREIALTVQQALRPEAVGIWLRPPAP